MLPSMNYPFHLSVGGGDEESRLIADFYRRTLLEDVAPFWLKHGVDRDFGGYLTCLDRDGSLLQGDKSVWFLGRMAWMFSRLALRYKDCVSSEVYEQWIEASALGIDFMERHAFDSDGRMFFSLTRDGRPLRKRRYLFSECFAAIALAAQSELTGESYKLKRAEDLLRLVQYYHKTPGLLEPKVNPETRPSLGLSLPMILLVTAQEVRRSGGCPTLCAEVISDSLAEIRLFVKPELRCVLEMVSPEGELIDTMDGRCLNPGHALEAGWFILEESRVHGADCDLRTLGLQMIEWSLEKGWDEQFGGILYFRDALGRPCTEYWHDMKFWWPHNEAILAALSAWRVSGNRLFSEWHDRIARWAFQHFRDDVHGEWYGYLHRDGTISTPVKGTLYKGFFHLPRMLMLADDLCRTD